MLRMSPVLSSLGCGTLGFFGISFGSNGVT